jgi:tRNA-splicing ligase RtcB (3'-phosphate/5'-hydroxy nucleic acid ligase)
MIEVQSSDGHAPIRMWLPPTDVEPAAMDQLRNSASHPEVGPAIAVMPDCHVGFGVTIGCVFPTIDAVIPNAVGVDIGCGMCAVNTGVHLDQHKMDRQFWRSWMGQVQRDVPTGFASFKQPQYLGQLERPLRATALQPLLGEKARFQIGTLGGGNHFLEAQVDQEGAIWLMVHSGSRHTGLRIADHYSRAAVASSDRRGLPVGRDLASLRLDEQAGQDYLSDMRWATDFALENRMRMIGAMLDAFADKVDKLNISTDVNRANVINIHHNFARLEDHAGRSMMIHRKGATSAALGQTGIIPGSMGAPSFIVRGKGNSLSFHSCSHGAGRTMSRKAAKRVVTESSFAEALKETHSRVSMGYADEAPLAYKDITTVIERQADLIDVVHVLLPIITIKGDSRAKDD